MAALGLLKRKVGLTWAVFGAYLSIIAFLVVFNTVNTPLIEKLRETRYIGRLGKVLQTEEGTGKVRVLIWEGVIDMVTPHDPLVTPGAEGGPDSANALRPLIGYGPESMYVAYNRFYPADLAHYEKRNASPDRSHNETFDALAQTGVVGFLVYMLVFASVFYYALKVLGLVRAPWQRWAFLGLWIGGGIVGALVSWLWGGPVYLGVGIPGGVIILGLGGYLLLVAAKGDGRPCLPRVAGRRPRAVGDRAPFGHHGALCRDPLWHRHRLDPHLLLGLRGASGDPRHALHRTAGRGAACPSPGARAPGAGRKGPGRRPNPSRCGQAGR